MSFGVFQMGKWRDRIETGRQSAVWQFIVVVYNELFRTRAFVVAAALAFYFVLSLVPLLFIFSSLLGFLPIPNLFGQLLDMMAQLVPPDAMALVQRIISSVIAPHRGGLLSFGVLGYLWASTGGFSAMIEALDIAYDVPVSRPWWRCRLQALLLTFTSGGLVLIALLAVIAGPSFGHMVTRVFPVPRSFGHAWPTIRHAVTFVAFLLSAIVLYTIGPNKKHSFRSTGPGALLAVTGWFAGSAGFTFYVGHFAHYNATYGSLGAVIVLMLWFYIIGLSVLIGAEMNAELAKKSQERRLSREKRDALGLPLTGVLRGRKARAKAS